jgi:ABC-type phosphate transport system substrate-binding protein
VTLTTRIVLPLLGLALSLNLRAKADIVAVVSARSAVTGLSAEQVAAIFLGRTSHFPDGTLAVPVDLSDGSVERDEFYTKVAGKTPAQLKAYWSKIIFTGRGQPPRAVHNDRDMKKYLADHPDAIGYIDSALVDDSVRVLL